MMSSSERDFRRSAREQLRSVLGLQGRKDILAKEILRLAMEDTRAAKSPKPKAPPRKPRKRSAAKSSDQQS